MRSGDIFISLLDLADSMKAGDVIVFLVGALLVTVGIIAIVDLVWPGTIKINAVNLAKAIGVSLLGIIVAVGVAMVVAVVTGKKFWEQD